MRSERVRLWIEVVSASAVVASLVLVAMELRSSTAQATLNTRALEVAAYQDLIAQVGELAKINIENPEFVEVRTRAARGDSLSPEEAIRVTNYWYLLFRHGDMAYYEYARGLLDRDRLGSVLGPLRQEFSNPDFATRWEARRASFAADYAAFIDSLYSHR